MLNQGKILIVDDEQYITEAMSRLFNGCGYATMVAENGSRALVLMDMNIVDLVVTDMHMPIVNGLELCKSIKREKKLPVILCTAVDEEDEEYSCFDAVLKKPLNFMDLKSVVTRLLHH